MKNNLRLTRGSASAVLLAALGFTSGVAWPAMADDTAGPQTTISGCSLQGGCPGQTTETLAFSEPSDPATASPTAAESGAVDWARAQIGQDIDSGKCLRFVVDAYAKGGGTDIGISYNAVDYWNEHADRQHPGDTAPPAGALVFWDATEGHPDGHVAIAEGGDTVISTTERSFTGIHEFSIADRNSTKPYLGWLLPD